MVSSNLNDDVAALSQVVGQLARLQLHGRPTAVLGPAAGAAGLPIAAAVQWLAGDHVLPPRQTIAFVGALLEQDRVTQASLALSARTPTQPREPSEASLEGAQAAVERMTKAWPGWSFSFDGADGFATGKVKLTWWARHPNRHDVSGANVHELEGKVRRWEAAGAENKKFGGRLFQNG